MSRRIERARSRKRRRSVLLAAVAVTATAALVGAAGVAWASGQLDPWLVADPQCTELVALTVVADTSIAPTVQAIAAEHDAQEGSCSATSVIAQDSADTAAMIAADTAPALDAWIPDSPVWPMRASTMASSLGRPALTVLVGRGIASSPVVFAAPVASASEFTGLEMTWKSLLDGRFRALLPDPEAASASLNALLSLRSKASSSEPRQFLESMLSLNTTIPTTADSALASLSVAEAGTVVITSEQNVVSHNIKAGAEPMFGSVPEDGTLTLSYPFIRLPPRAGDDGAQKNRSNALRELERALASADEQFEAAGFRGAESGATDGSTTGTTMEVGPAAASAQLEILRSWSVLSVRSRILTVIDLSGSMEEATETGLRRIDVVLQAASSTLDRFSGEVELGIWGFSSDRVDGRDWEELAPIERLASVQHRQLLGGVIASLPERLGGGTGLYDTTLAAVQAMRASYDPSTVNSVLLLTDGRNEDDDGISGEELLAELAAMNDPSKPVPVLLVGIGPDTDLDSMRKIAGATGGAAYSASRPEDLSDVLTDALTQRACRPNC